MTMTLPDNILSQAGISEQEARLELACRLFDLERLDLWPAAQLAGLSRVDFEFELHKRKIALYRPTFEEVQQDLAALRRGGI